jgi:hypothetical protein
MAPESPLGFEQLLTEQIGSLVHTVADPHGMTEAQRAAKVQSVTNWLMSFQPCDGIEIMLASHCVIYDKMLQANARDFLRTPEGPVREQAQSGILATGKMFLNAVNSLLRKQGRATVKTAAKTSTEAPGTAVPEAPPREAAEPVMPSIAPDFMPGPVNVPREAQPGDAARFGAAFRQRDATMAFADRRPSTEVTGTRRLNGVSHAAMLIMSGSTGRFPRPDLDRITSSPHPEAAILATEPPSRRRTSAPRAAVPHHGHPTTATVSSPRCVPPF